MASHATPRIALAKKMASVSDNIDLRWLPESDNA
jgi:hypothetical protein